MRPKDQGTWYETDRVNWLTRFMPSVRRLSEGGNNDIGDIEAVDPLGDTWIIECRWRQNMPAHRALAKAKAKTKAALDRGDVDAVAGTVLFWKRTILKDGNVKRSADGEPDIVIMDMDTFESLLRSY